MTEDNTEQGGVRCSACGALSSVTARFCQECGHSLNIIEPILDRVTSGQHGWLANVQQDADISKDLEEKASQARLAAMWKQEAQRLEELSRERAERNRQQRMLLWGSLGTAVVLVILTVIVLLVTTSKAPMPSGLPFP